MFDFSIVTTFIDNLLRVLGTDYKALTAQNALIADYVRLVAGKAYGFHGTMAYAFVAVFAI